MTTNKDLATPANGSNVGAWDVPVNANFNAIDSAFGGKATIATTGGTTVLTSAQYQPIFLVITGILTSNAIIQFPAGVGGQWVVLNSTTGAFTVTFSAGGGGGTYTLAQSIRTVIVCDGSTYGVTLSSNLAATAAAAGSSTQVQFNTSGILDASANLTFNGTNLTVSGAVASGTLTPTTALAPAYGGTGATSLPSNAVLIGNNLGTIASVAPGTAGNVLTSNGTTWSSTVPTSGGNVFLSGTPVNGQLAQWVSGTAVQGITTGTGVVTALGVNTGSAGSVLLNGGALVGTTLSASGAATLSSTLDVTGVSTLAGNLNVTGAQTLSIAPTANPPTTLVSVNVQGSTKSSTTREFQTALGLTNNKGVGLTGGNQDRVTLYVGHDAVAGSGDGWALNSVLTMEATAEPTSNYQGYELDFNNLLAHRGEALQGAGLAAPVAYGLTVTGASSFRSTSAIAVSGPGTPIWNRGIVFGNSSVAQATIQDLTSSTISVEILGTHNYGIDMRNGAFTTAALRLGNGAFIRARDAGDTADLAVLVQSGANLIIADAATTGTFFRGTTTVAPFVDNAIVSGSNTNRWSAVWAVNGTIQTSDPREKTNIQTLTDVNTGRVIDVIEPISFRWVDGGNGKPGVRTHWGFDASKMEQVAEIAGRDWGGFVRDEDGGLALRPDQIIPILFEEMRRLRKRVADLEVTK